nr:hypothetical protein [Tanacetum cinerariifolium]
EYVAFASLSPLQTFIVLDYEQGKTVIGPTMPTVELLVAAAKLTKAEAELREAEVSDDDVPFIGPPPPVK